MLVSLQEPQRHRHVLQLLRAERRLTAVARHALPAELLDERDQVQAILQVRLQRVDPPVARLQVLIGPASECVLLDALPLGVLRQSRSSASMASSCDGLAGLDALQALAVVAAAGPTEPMTATGAPPTGTDGN